MGLRVNHVMRVPIHARFIGYPKYFHSHYWLGGFDYPFYFNCQITAANGTEDYGSGETVSDLR